MIKVTFNAFRNGACPLCKKNENCPLIKAMEIALSVTIEKNREMPMEIVVYRCPEFQEK
jgi:hypothetical protein